MQIYDLVQHLCTQEPSDYDLFPKRKKEHSGCHFDRDDGVTAAVDPFLEVQDDDVGIRRLDDCQTS